jgi:NAD(P)-dependent dehydrogenase (short-subunit alcohol dehydrogenase family)
MSSPVVLITGALTGIGRATALAFANEGARVVISGRREEEGKRLLAELRKLGAEPNSCLPTFVTKRICGAKAPRLNKLCNSSCPEVEVNSSSHHENLLVRG